MNSPTRALTRFATALALAAAGLLLAWEFFTNAPTWSNGWLEGASYALAALALWVMAVMLWRGATGAPLFLFAAAIVPLLPGLWCLRWAYWLATTGPEIGPTPAYFPAGFALVGVALVAGSVALVQRGTRGNSHESDQFR